MLRLAGAVAIAACMHAGSLWAQEIEGFGQKLPTGNLPQASPQFDSYEMPGGVPGRFGGGRASQALTNLQKPEPPLRLRGPKEVALFRRLATSVVLILQEESLGSGSVIAVRTVGNQKVALILTNWHVVQEAEDVGVVYKPLQDNLSIESATVREARVLKLDPVRDLALIEVTGVPAYVTPVELGSMEEVQIGNDVHAIGHPIGETWSYTKGIVSQIRQNYEWNEHRADVIQTQTPLSPGNSGGPLFADSGKMIGVNSFKAKGGDNLNFAVSVDDVRKFLAASQSGAFNPKRAGPECKPKTLYEGRSTAGDAYIRAIDLKCTGAPTGVLFIPDDKKRAIEFHLDTNGDGQTDAIIYDDNRDGKWDRSTWDSDYDGKPDLVGFHPDGKLEPSRFEKYVPKK